MPLVNLFPVSDDSMAATLNGEEFLEWSNFLTLTSHPASSRPLTLDSSEGLTVDESTEIYYQF